MCDKHKFVQVHCHTSASLLDGVNLTNNLAKKAKELGHPALAITDHGNPANLFDHYRDCKKNGIKPILGLEFYICNDLRSRVSNKNRSFEDKDFHQSVYIKNKEGYRNFCELTYRSFTDGYYYKPRIDFTSLFELKKGLKLTSSCMASKTSQLITSNRHSEAEEMFRKFVVEFGTDFYGEIQFNEVQGQKEINDFIIHLCNKYDVPLLIGGDVHYLNKEDNLLQDAIIRSKRSSSSKDDGEKDWVISARNLYYHDTSDYYDFNKRFGFNYDTKVLEKAFENSIKFSEEINFEFETGKYHLPKINTGEKTSKQYLEEKTWNGLIERISLAREQGHGYTDEEISKYEKQVEYELQVINDLGLNDYMLLMNKIVTWCKENDLYVGPGRGSAAGSLVAWALYITGVDPMKHNLIFERFVNPYRKVMCDIDTDFEQGARDLILQFLINEFGQESVCNVATFGLYGPKSALQDMSRGLNKSTDHDSVLMRKITKLDGLEDTPNLIQFFDKVKRNTTDKEVLEWIDNNEDTIEFAQRVQGQMRQLGVHAGGILITPGPVYNFIPVTRGSGNLISAFKESDGSGKDLSELGLIKLDVLGLKTLNVLKECVNNIKKDKGIDLYNTLYNLDLNDKKIIEYFASGNNFGIFQMDRSKMFTSKIKVNSFKDINAINAINRPGPLEKYLNKYGFWKQVDEGTIEVTPEDLEEINNERYPYSFMKNILSETYGCLLYQEQFMYLVCEAAGLDLGEADNFRRGIAWLPDNPKYHTVAKYYEKLEQGMLSKGYSKQDTDKFVQYCRDFAGYSFNKSHSTVYSYIAFQTLYLKVYYPAYFYAAMLNMEHDTDLFKEIISDAQKNGIEILPHSITKSKYTTIVENDKTIRLGYRMVKGMGGAVQEELEVLELHKCTTLEEVLNKPFKKINTTMLQNLIELGCFDEFNVERAKLETLKELYQDEKIEFWFTRQKQKLRIEVIPSSLQENFEPEECLKIAMKVKNEENPHIKLINQLIPKIKIRKVNEDNIKRKTSKKQIELLGFSLVNDNPLAKYESAFQIKGILSLKDFDESTSNEQFYFLLSKKEIKLTQKGKQYLQLSLSDGVGLYKAKCWSVLQLEEGNIYYGRFKKDNYGFTLDSKEVILIE